MNSAISGLRCSCYRDVILSTMLNRRAAGLGAAFGSEMLGLKLPAVPEEVWFLSPTEAVIRCGI